MALSYKPMQGITSKMNDPDRWQEAQDRVLLYLKKLGVPALRSLELAEIALKQAMADKQAVGSELPVQLAMRALHQIIHADRSILNCSTYKDYPVVFFRWRQGNFETQSKTGKESYTDLDLSASPPINRGCMVIRKL